MTIDQLIVFHKIISLGSFKAAANALHKTQPAISFSIKKLEEELQVDLFDRTNYRPILTTYGEAFFQSSIKLLEEMDKLELLAQSFQNKNEASIDLSLDGVCLKPSLLKFLKEFSDEHPFTKIRMNFDILGDPQRRVLNKEVQFGLTHFITEMSSLEIVPITSIQMVPVMSRELYEAKAIKKQQDLMHIDQIIVTDKKPMGPSFGIYQEGKKWRLEDSNFKQDIILAGLGWGHLAYHSIEKEIESKNLVVLEFEDIHPRDLSINLIRLKKQHLGPIAKKLWDELISFHQ